MFNRLANRSAVLGMGTLLFLFNMAKIANAFSSSTADASNAISSTADFNMTSSTGNQPMVEPRESLPFVFIFASACMLAITAAVCLLKSSPLKCGFSCSFSASGTRTTSSAGAILDAGGGAQLTSIRPRV